MRLCEAPEIIFQSSNLDPNYYQNLLHLSITQDYTSKQHASAIAQDVERSFPNHPSFEQEALSNVLNAYSVHNPDVGYFQGMNLIAGLLLIVTEFDEEDAFWLLVALIDYILPHDSYTPNMESSLFERFTALDVVGPYEVLHWVPNVVVKFVADEAGKDVNAEHGTLSMKSTASYDDLPNPHIVLVPGGPGITEALTDQRLLNWIKQAHTTSMFTTSVCIGGIILASLGLLKGLTATTHWNFYEQLASYGAIPIEQRVIRHGKIITSAGVSSGIDMALHLVAILKGDDMSKIMQLFVEYDPQPPFDSGSATKAKEDGTLERTLDMIPQLEARAELMYNQLVNNKD